MELEKLADGWVSHEEGGGCPVHGNTEVLVRFRDGIVGQGKASLWWSADIGRSLWIHRNRPSDIMAYKLVNTSAALHQDSEEE